MYDGIVLLIGFLLPESLLIFLNKFRFIFHGLLVPLLILFCGYKLDASGKTYYINLFINIILSIIGTIVGIISKIKIVEGSVLKRYTLSVDVSKIELLIFTLINIGCVIYMIIVGVILFIKKKIIISFYQVFLCSFFQLLVH